MPDRARILVVAATARELAVAEGWSTLCCGVGPVDAAAATAAAIARVNPAIILHVGIAGARQTLGLAPATLVIGDEAHYSDLGVDARWAPNTLPADATLLARAQHTLPHAITRRIGTSARIGGTRDTDVEAMEGFAVLRAAALAGIPALEVRAISNDIEEADRTRWHFEAAFAAITAATPPLVNAFVPLVTHA